MYNYKPTTTQINALVTNAVVLSVHEKLDHTNLLGANMLQKGASEEEIKQGEDGKYHILHTSLHWVVDSRANAEFSIFIIYLTVVCTFLHHLHQVNLA